MKSSCQLLLLMWFILPVSAQDYLGVDLSYVNEMEDCGVVYKIADEQRDPYQLFAEHGANLVRLRLWHTPNWYDDLNSGARYSDLPDVKRSIARAKANGMQVLLDFQLSDNWADPSKQIIPAAWAHAVDDLEVLRDSLHNYLYAVLTELASESLWPDLIQLGNETNRGILLSQEQNDSGWVLDWDRNAALFNAGIAAIRLAASEAEQSVKIGLHLAGPANVEWFLEGFETSGVSDYDFIGLSYYWAWHQPTTITETGEVVNRLRQTYPEKEVIILETGYIWTTEWNDTAANIISDTHVDYEPPSPDAQRQWLIDLTQEVISNGGHGVLYWEPAWVSSPCWTQWGQGSHQEHATFFDFDNNLLPDGGIAWLAASYDPTAVRPPLSTKASIDFKLTYLASLGLIELSINKNMPQADWRAELISLDGQRLQNWKDITFEQDSVQLNLPELSSGIFFLVLSHPQGYSDKEALVISK